MIMLSQSNYSIYEGLRRIICPCHQVKPPSHPVNKKSHPVERAGLQESQSGSKREQSERLSVSAVTQAQEIKFIK